MMFDWKKTPVYLRYVAVPLAILGMSLHVAFAVLQFIYLGDFWFLVIAIGIPALVGALFVVSKKLHGGGVNFPTSKTPMIILRPKTFHKNLQEMHWFRVILAILFSSFVFLGLLTLTSLFALIVFNGTIFQVGVAVATGIVAATLLVIYGALKALEWVWELR